MFLSRSPITRLGLVLAFAITVVAIRPASVHAQQADAAAEAVSSDLPRAEPHDHRATAGRLVNGELRVELVAGEKVEGDTGLVADTTYHLFMCVGRTPGRVEGYYIRKCHVNAYPDDTEVNGIEATGLSVGLTTGYTSPGVVYFQG